MPRKTLCPIKNKGENGSNVGVKEVFVEIKLLFQDHDIKDMEVSRVGAVGEVVAAEGSFSWEQPISTMIDLDSHEPEITMSMLI